MSAHLHQLMSDCTLCPRNCHVDRLSGKWGYCGQTAEIRAARASLHMWEEPCISGSAGSGTVFFSGCNLKCVFCQNHNIAVGKAGQPVTVQHLADIYLSLQDKGANNINLVTPSHFVPQVCDSLALAKSQGLTLPVVYNTGSYEHVDTLKLLDGLVDVYLPDLKYFSPEISLRYSYAADYFEKACAAIAEMFRQVRTPVFHYGTVYRDDLAEAADALSESYAPKGNVRSEPGIMTRGVIVRHLILPGQTKDSKKILRYLHTTYGNDIYISIMNQYTPLPHVADIPELNCKVTSQEYERILDFALRIGIENGFFQEGEAASESFIPEFDGSGL